jgi:hypothetical protein
MTRGVSAGARAHVQRPSSAMETRAETSAAAAPDRPVCNAMTTHAATAKPFPRYPAHQATAGEAANGKNGSNTPPKRWPPSAGLGRRAP